MNWNTWLLEALPAGFWLKSAISRILRGGGVNILRLCTPGTEPRARRVQAALAQNARCARALRAPCTARARHARAKQAPRVRSACAARVLHARCALARRASERASERVLVSV